LKALAELPVWVMISDELSDHPALNSIGGLVMDWWLIILALIAAALAYLNAFEGGSEARRGIGRWINYYNGDRPHSSHNGLTPNEAYETNWKGEKLAA
jgi:putative transposase